MPRAQLAHSRLCTDMPACLQGCHQAQWALSTVHGCYACFTVPVYSLHCRVAWGHVTATPNLLKADVGAGTEEECRAQLTRWVSMGLSVSGLRASTTRGP